MTLTPDIEKLKSEMSAAVREHWKAFLIEGIILVILGLAAIILPPLASLAVTILLGWMFLISGVAGFALTLWARGMPGFWWSLLSAALAIGAGIILLLQPVQGALTLDHRGRRLFPRRRRHHHHVRARTSPRIVRALVLAC